MPMKILMMAGEVSGDYQGSFLAEALLAREPGIELFGTGQEIRLRVINPTN